MYQLYYDTPKVALEMAKEVRPDSPDEAFQEAMYDGKHEEIQACFYLEHRKRLAVAFAATRCAALRPRPGMWAPHTSAAFKELVNQVLEQEAWQLPTLLQLYVLGFGGLACSDAEDQEFAALARQANCDASDVADLLGMFDQLFPYPGTGATWFFERNEMVSLKLMPVPLRAAGLRMREALYGKPWAELATESQLRTCGPDQLELAEMTARR